MSYLAEQVIWEDLVWGQILCAARTDFLVLQVHYDATVTEAVSTWRHKRVFEALHANWASEVLQSEGPQRSQLHSSISGSCHNGT